MSQNTEIDNPIQRVPVTDTLIHTYKCEPYDDEGDLMKCPVEGIAYQADMSASVEYDKAYFEKYVSYEDSDIAVGINEVRKSLTEKYAHCVLDVGIGSGEFIKKSALRCYGYDINRYGIEWLKARNSYLDPHVEIPDCIDGISLWDTMEHITSPCDLLTLPRVGTYVFISMPIFDDLSQVKASKHYRPNEHYYYFSKKGLVTYMYDVGYDLVEISDGETAAGRESILSFVFLKVSSIQRDRKLMAPIPADSVAAQAVEVVIEEPKPVKEPAAPAKVVVLKKGEVKIKGVGPIPQLEVAQEK